MLDIYRVALAFLANKEKVFVAEPYIKSPCEAEESPVPPCVTVAATSPNSDQVCPGFGAAAKTKLTTPYPKKAKHKPINTVLE